MGERNPVPSVHHRPPQARPRDRKNSKSLFLSTESTVRSSIGGDVPHGQLPSARADVGVRFEHCGWLLLYGNQLLTLLSCFLHQKILPGAENFILPEEILLVQRKLTSEVTVRLPPVCSFSVSFPFSSSFLLPLYSQSVGRHTCPSTASVKCTIVSTLKRHPRSLIIIVIIIIIASEYSPIE